MVEVVLLFCPRCKLKWVLEPDSSEYCPRCRRYVADKIPPYFRCLARARETHMFNYCEHGYLYPALCKDCPEMKHLTVALLPE